MPKINPYRLTVVLSALIVILTTTAAYTARETEDIANSVLRLHIIANSDSAADQSLKLKVRDEVIKECAPLFKHCKNAQQSQAAAASNIDFITQTANKVIADSGFDYTAECYIGKCGFPTKTYQSLSDGQITLPKGEYSAVNIRLGEAKGQNWWCVMYPPLCFVNGVAAFDSAESLRNELSPSEYELITESGEPSVRIRFKIAELLAGRQ